MKGVASIFFMLLSVSIKSLLKLVLENGDAGIFVINSKNQSYQPAITNTIGCAAVMQKLVT